MGEKDIIEALLKVQEQIENPRTTKTNPFTKSKYASLPDILNQVRPLLTEQGILLLQNAGTDTNGNLFVQTRLLYNSDKGQETIETDRLILHPDTGKMKSNIQGIGSAITYGRRYQLMTLLGIAGEGEDDDGTNTTPPPPSPRRREKKQPKTTQKTKPTKKDSEPEVEDVVEGEARKWKKISTKNPTIKKICDNLSQAGLGINKDEIKIQAEKMKKEGTLTNTEYNKIQTILNNF